MALMFSAEALRSMGFRPIAPDELLEASFHSLHVFAIQGLTIDEGPVITSRGSLTGTPYEFAIGHRPNAISRVLLGDDLAEDEAAWAKEHNCAPPYALIHLGPTAQHSIQTGHVKEEEANWTTYDSLRAAKDELKRIEAQVLPPLLTSLNCTFSSEDNRVRFNLVCREVFGFTPSGAVVHDIRVEGHATGEVSRRLTADALQATVDRTTTLASRVSPKVSRFFRLAVEEDDPLKQFLYFFLSIEIQTHATFSSIDHSANVARLLNSEDRVRGMSTAFFEAQRQRWTNLMDRFVWCAICAWPQCTDADISEFKRLKKIRDDIAHGSIAEPPGESVKAAETLAMKLQRSCL